MEETSATSYAKIDTLCERRDLSRELKCCVVFDLQIYDALEHYEA